MPRYLPEPTYRHGSPAQTAVLLINLVTPLKRRRSGIHCLATIQFP